MRPYRFRMRLSSIRLNVTRLGELPAAALRAAAWLSLGSASSDIELMERLLSSQRHDRANSGRLQEGLWRRRPYLVAADCPAPRFPSETTRHGIVSGIIIPP